MQGAAMAAISLAARAWSSGPAFHCAEDHDKLVAAQAAHRISCAQSALQPAGYFFQKQVSRLVAVVVIDLFEVVQVQKPDGKHAFVPAVVRAEHLEPVLQEHPVG